MSKENVLKTMFERTLEDEIENCIGDGGRLTECPQRVAYYVRGRCSDVIGLSNDSNTNMGERIRRLEEFINTKTQWKLVARYTDIVNVTFKNFESNYEMTKPLSNQISLKTLLDDIQKNRVKIDMLVVDSITQISRDVQALNQVLEKLFLKQVIIFCLDSNEVFTLDGRILDSLIPRKLFPWFYDPRICR